MLKSFIRKLVPEPIINLYHLALARLAAVAYGHPSDDLIVVGVTGTNGKTSTCHFIGRILEQAGKKVGWATTADFKVGDKEWVNDKKMTMLGRFQTQKLLKQMVEAGCRYAIVETSSQGIAQFRHVGINYDVAVLTNLTPEHIEAHGGFENYKQAKGRLFSHTHGGKRKVIEGKVLEKTAVVNAGSEHAEFFLSFGLERQFGFGVEDEPILPREQAQYKSILAKNLSIQASGTSFSIKETRFRLKPIGRFYFENALCAIATTRALGLEWEAIAGAVSTLEPVPGRLESIDQGQDFAAIVDYAYEPAALQAVYNALDLIEKNRIIHIIGSAGGGRDVARRKILGEMAAQHDDIVIVTNEDPYDEDPMQIIHNVADAAAEAGKTDGTDLFRILDRQEAINKAAELAEPGDLVLITGKGSEPVMAVKHGKKIPWDDREAARKAIKSK